MAQRNFFVFNLFCCLFLAGCESKKEPDTPTSALAGDNMATFSLAWSEYPSWSVFGVADELGIIDGESGKLGEIEQAHGVDIVLQEASYDSCLNMYSSGDCDAVCITNMDALIVSPSRDSVAVMPTSTSQGADACLVTSEITSPEDLKGKSVFGLKGTVSEYCFVRCLQKRGLDEKEFTFTNQDPGAAATAMQQRAETHQAIMVWNPFVLQTLNDRSDVNVLFDSSEIPGEIVDMVVIAKDSLAKPGGEKFVRAVAATFYRICQELDGERGDELLVALGKKFSNLDLDAMRKVVQQTVFYRSPEEAVAWIEGDQFRSVMKTVEEFCTEHGLVQEPSVGFGAEGSSARLQFDVSRLK
jgi:NitT/TauT family transport system substrate-binding protein